MRELLKVKVREVLGEEVLEISELHLEDSESIMIATRSYELTIRCNMIGRCEVMLRHMDNPAVMCTIRCYEDPASSLDKRLLVELRAKVETLIESLGVKLLELGDLG